MKITVIGASGLIGTKVAGLLTAGGHEVVAAARGTGVDVLTGEGLGEALAAADALVDVTNSPSFEDGPVMEFFTTATTNIVAAAKNTGVGHYVVLSIVGVEGLPDSGYLRAKVAQEKLLADSGVPYSIVRATQFAEFTDAGPLNGVVNIGGPEKIPFEQMARESLARRGDDTKTVVVDPEATYFGTPLQRNSLVTPD